MVTEALLTLHEPQPGPGIEPCSWLGIEPSTLWSLGQHSNHWENQPGLDSFYQSVTVFCCCFVVFFAEKSCLYPLRLFSFYSRCLFWSHSQCLELCSCGGLFWHLRASKSWVRSGLYNLEAQDQPMLFMWSMMELLLLLPPLAYVGHFASASLK